MAKKIIIIDDNIDDLNKIKNAFASIQWDTYGCKTVREAFEIIYEIAPDLIISKAIMPKCGAYQLLKIFRNDELLSKIPTIIVYEENKLNLNFYINKEYKEYFIAKQENFEEKILELALNITQKEPVNEELKHKIIENSINSPTIYPSNSNPHKKINEEFLGQQLKIHYNFSISDEKLFAEIFQKIFPILNYDLCVLCVHNFKKNIPNIFFDIKNIILSRDLCNNFGLKFKTKDMFFYKQYSPNLKIINKESEFFSELEFDFEYNSSSIAHIIFYSQKKDMWRDLENINILKRVLEKFFKARHVNKNSTRNKNENKIDGYFLNKLDLNFLEKFKLTSQNNIFVGIIHFLNYSYFYENLTEEEFDILNSKISQKIIGYIEINEQAYKNDSDEYTVIIFASNDKEAKNKFDFLYNIINSIEYDNIKVEVVIGITNATIKGVFDIYEAKKIAQNIIDEFNINQEERVIIK